MHVIFICTIQGKCSYSSSTTTLISPLKQIIKFFSSPLIVPVMQFPEATGYKARSQPIDDLLDHTWPEYLHVLSYKRQPSMFLCLPANQHYFSLLKIQQHRYHDRVSCFYIYDAYKCTYTYGPIYIEVLTSYTIKSNML